MRRHQDLHARRARLVLTTALVFLVIATGPARAEPPQNARELYTLGRTHFVEKRYAEAAAALEQSIQIYPSPNSLVLLGHVDEQLGKRAAAVALYDRAIRLGREENARTPGKYDATIEEATRAHAALRAVLGELVVVGPPKATVRIQGNIVDTDEGADPVRVVQLHEPGNVTVEILSWGRHQVRTATLVAGKTTQIAFDTRAPLDPDAHPGGGVIDSGPGAWLPAGIVVGSIGVVALGVATGLRVDAASIDDDLTARCGTGCGAADRELADRGAAEQNASGALFVTGGAALAAGVIVLVVGALDEDVPLAGRTSPRWRFVGVPGATGLGGAVDF